MSKTKKIEAIYPLSPLQRGILFHSLYAPESGLYFQQALLTLRGALNTAAFEQTWHEITLQHDILRTLFVWEGQEKPLQVVVEQVKVPFQQRDWRNLTRAEQQELLEAFLEEDRRLGFDLTRAPLARLTLIRVEDDAYELVWSFHHLLLDGWSMSLILRDVFACYEALSKNEPLSFERSRSYRDYITWLQKQDLSEAEAYWRQTLKGFTTPTRLGVGRASEAEGDYLEQELRLGEETASQLQSMARRNKLTLNTLVQGAWALLLGHYSGEADIVYGVIVSGRPASLSGAQYITGLFINTLPMRANLSWDVSTLSWLRSFQDQMAEMSQYEYSPLVEVQGWSEVPRGVQLFDTLFAFENYPVDARLFAGGGGLSVESIRAIEKTNYPITVVAVPGEGLAFKIIYDSRRFDVVVIERMLGHLKTLLEGMIANIEGRLSELPLLTQAERDQLLVEWNDTHSYYEGCKGIYDLFEQQVERDPEAVAAVWGDERLSYGELNRRANRLAHYLRNLGVGPEVVVGVCLERSIEMLIGLLGILKAGGAYLPLDPAYPKERLSFMMEDAMVKVLLTDERRPVVLPEFCGKTVCVDSDREAIARQSDQNPPCVIEAENVAYIIYTSGSTGKPKGIAIEHRSTIAFLRWVGQVFDPGQLAGVLASTSICFDISIFELFAPLSFGGKLIIAENVLHLPDLSSAGEITLINTVPSAIAGLLKTKGLPDGARTVNLAGEPFTNKLAQQIYEHERVERLYNLYGPSEDTTYTTYALIKREDTSPPSIGRPISNTKIYLFDSSLHPVPAGVTGEIYIAGRGLARGYINRPDVTAERFLPDPFGCGRLYRTGDLGRYLPDGNIDFLGRIDHQVKIRGYRIEPGEVEDVLSRHPAVREAVVIARGEASGDKRLAAYVVAHPNQSPHTGELQNYLRAKMPDYMVPSVFVMLERLPLTPNGKLNRRALPEPDRSRPELEKECVAPRTGVEKTVAEIWAEVLGLERVGVYDNFFELGGHSLLVMQVVSRIYKAFKVELPLRDFFKAPTVVDLVMAIALRHAELQDREKVAQALAGLE